MATDEVDEISSQFVAAWQQAEEYPLTLLRTEVFGYDLESFRERLREDGLFRPSPKMLAVRDLRETATSFDQGRYLHNNDDVKALLNPNEKDPWWRFMSAKPLSSPCSPRATCEIG